ncbi:MAG TPA: hypothetical protein VGS19_20755 [Streptosporangiaceae bacterium]|nr:hypothetical protein [Streptosporangiaceae bacterium]
MSTVDHPRRATAERGAGHRDYEAARHQLAGERERMAFHFHQFNHGCYGDHCLESDQLYAAWQAALARARTA